MFVCMVICWQTLSYISHIVSHTLTKFMHEESRIHAQLNSGEMIFYITYGNNLDGLQLEV